jgi:hypothetical protein
MNYKLGLSPLYIFKNCEKIHCLIPLCCAIGHNAVLSKLISNFSLSFLHRLQTSRIITLIPLFILFIYMYYIFMHFLPVSGEYKGHYYPYIFITYSPGINYELCLKTHFEKIKTCSLNLCSVILIFTELFLNILWPHPLNSFNP